MTHRRRGSSFYIFRLAILLAFAIPVLSGCSSRLGSFAQPGQDPMQTPRGVAADLSDYRLDAGDRIRLVVYGEPNLTGEFGVDGAGRMGVPLVGTMRAGGLTAAELEDRIVARLSPEYLKDPKVTVEIIGYRPFYIVGEVKSPGSYPYVSGMTAINAVALAGGFTYRARETEFVIDRALKGKPGQIAAGPGSEVLPGDVIIVPERFF
jgi:polysaccharide export outer membrane protein